MSPVPNQSGRTTVTITANDNQGGVSRESFELVVDAVADSPTLAVTDARGEEDTPIPLAIRASLTDVDGSESLSVRISGVPSTAVLSSGVKQSDGAWLLAPADLTGLALTPPPNAAGVFPLQVTAISTESSNANTTQVVSNLRVSVDEVNDRPTVTAPLGSRSSDEDAPRSIIPLSAVFSDPDIATASDRLAYSIRRNDNPTLVAASVLDDRLMLDLLAHQHGTATIVIRATDLAGLFVEDTLSLTVKSINDPPRITSSDRASVSENARAVMTVAASDPDGDVPTFAIRGGADQTRLEIDATSGVLRFRSAPDFENPTDADANNVYEVLVDASDGQRAVASQLIRVTVTDVDERAPTVSIVRVSPDIRAAAVSQMTITFTEPVAGLDLGDLSLTRTTDQTVSLLPATATLTTSDNVTWTLGNLDPLTAASGIYRLTLTAAGSGIADAGGNLLVQSAAASWTNGAGDANQDGRFDQIDVIAVLQAAKYRTGQSATWSQGDWNGDGLFNQFDIIVSQQTQPPHYLAGPFF
jgi:hypothetical protein